MFRDITKQDKSIFTKMVKNFYSSSAVSHSIDDSIVDTNFNNAINNSELLRVFIIEDESKPVGFAMLTFGYATEIGSKVVLLEDLYLDATCRGKGIGSKFITFIEKEYPEAKRFYLEVTKENTRAIDLYKKHGYEEVEYLQMMKDIK